MSEQTCHVRRLFDSNATCKDFPVEWEESQLSGFEEVSKWRIDLRGLRLVLWLIDFQVWSFGELRLSVDSHRCEKRILLSQHEVLGCWARNDSIGLLGNSSRNLLEISEKIPIVKHEKLSPFLKVSEGRKMLNRIFISRSRIHNARERPKLVDVCRQSRARGRPHRYVYCTLTFNDNLQIYGMAFHSNLSSSNKSYCDCRIQLGRVPFYSFLLGFPSQLSVFLFYTEDGDITVFYYLISSLPTPPHSLLIEWKMELKFFMSSKWAAR